jgi:hypothetical protein
LASVCLEKFLTDFAKCHSNLSHAKIWTDNQIALFKELYPQENVSTEYLQQLLGRSQQALHHKALELGLRRPSTIWTHTQIELLKQLYLDPEVSRKDIATRQWSLLGCDDFLAIVKRHTLRATAHVRINGPIRADKNRSPHLHRIYVGNQQAIVSIDYILNASGLGLPRKHFSIDSRVL